jgi:hypothetical protein
MVQREVRRLARPLNHYELKVDTRTWIRLYKSRQTILKFKIDKTVVSGTRSRHQ